MISRLVCLSVFLGQSSIQSDCYQAVSEKERTFGLTESVARHCTASIAPNFFVTPCGDGCVAGHSNTLDPPAYTHCHPSLPCQAPPCTGPVQRTMCPRPPRVQPLGLTNLGIVSIRMTQSTLFVVLAGSHSNMLVCYHLTYFSNSSTWRTLLVCFFLLLLPVIVSSPPPFLSAARPRCFLKNSKLGVHHWGPLSPKLIL